MVGCGGARCVCCCWDGIDRGCERDGTVMQAARTHVRVRIFVVDTFGLEKRGLERGRGLDEGCGSKCHDAPNKSSKRGKKPALAAAALVGSPSRVGPVSGAPKALSSAPVQPRVGFFGALLRKFVVGGGSDRCFDPRPAFFRVAIDRSIDRWGTVEAVCRRETPPAAGRALETRDAPHRLCMYAAGHFFARMTTTSHIIMSMGFVISFDSSSSSSKSMAFHDNQS